ncbi:MAG: DUF1080 domain-containing protein [Planctomycetia bacterium]
MRMSMPWIFMIVAIASGSAAEAADSVDLLSNGLQGWVVEGTRDFDNRGDRVPVWTFAEGVVRSSGHGFGFLRNKRQVSDFRLELEYRFAKNGNSGVGIRTCPYVDTVDSRPSQAGYEVQLLSDSGQRPSLTSGGSLYAHAIPSQNTSRAIGEWNSLAVECRGPRIRVIHNGVDVVDFDQSTQPTAEQKPLRGSVCLQNHGSAVEFRCILLTDLSPDDVLRD